MKVSAVLVIVLGVLMFSRGLNLSGISTAYAAPGSGNTATIQGNVQLVSTSMAGGRYSPIVVQKGIPVVWTIKANRQDLNGCNGQLTVPAYNIQKQLVPGDNVIKFTPAAAGTIAYTCWMGMVSSTISVVPDINNVASNDIQSAQAPGNQAPTNQGSQGLGGLLGGGCCGGGTPPANQQEFADPGCPDRRQHPGGRRQRRCPGVHASDHRIAERDSVQDQVQPSTA
jgi:hypothetical protein